VLFTTLEEKNVFCWVFLSDRPSGTTIVKEEVFMNKILFLAAVALSLAACAPAAEPAPAPVAKPSAKAITGKTAAASLMNSAGKNVGTVTFAETAGGLRAIVRIMRFAPGKYDTAIHVGGSCNVGDPLFNGAGDAFKAELGQLQSFEVSGGGSGIISGLNPHLTVAAGPYSVVGKTVLIKTDKSRIACGQIATTN
jgi:Cu/Zn superoxide dismutase